MGVGAVEKARDAHLEVGATKPAEPDSASTGTCQVRSCAGTTYLHRARSAQLRYLAIHGERDEFCCSGHEAGRRRAIGVGAADHVSSARPRRWCDAGAPQATQKAGDPGTVTVGP